MVKMPSSVEFEEEICLLLRQWFGGMGLCGTAAAIAARIFVEPGETSLEELANKTGYSPASISSALNTSLKPLEAIGAIRKYSKPGSKKLYVIGEKDLVKTRKRAIKLKLDNQIRPTQKKLPDLLKKYSCLKDEKSKKQLEQLKEFNEALKGFDGLCSAILAKGDEK